MTSGSCSHKNVVIYMHASTYIEALYFSAVACYRRDVDTLSGDRECSGGLETLEGCDHGGGRLGRCSNSIGEHGGHFFFLY